MEYDEGALQLLQQGPPRNAVAAEYPQYNVSSQLLWIAVVTHRTDSSSTGQYEAYIASQRNLDVYLLHIWHQRYVANLHTHIGAPTFRYTKNVQVLPILYLTTHILDLKLKWKQGLVGTGDWLLAKRRSCQNLKPELHQRLPFIFKWLKDDSTSFTSVSSLWYYIYVNMVQVLDDDC